MNRSMSNESLFGQLHELITARELGEWTDQQHEQLERLLLESAEARRLYLAYMNDSASLHLRAHRVKEEAGVMADAGGGLDDSGRRFGRGWWMGVAVGWAAVLTLAAVGLWMKQRDPKPADAFAMDPVARPRVLVEEGVAVLRRTVEAKWADDSDRSLGPVLRPGKLKLVSGSVQIDFRSGASVILEGPAEFELISALKARLHHGKLRADVPPAAKGFTVAVKDLDVVDYGTEFGLSHNENGDTEVHVINGEVRVRGVGNGAAVVEKKLITGQGLLIRTTGMLDLFMADAGAFISRAKIAYLQHLAAQKQYDRWLNHSDRLAHDPDLIVYYTFEDQKTWDQTLINRAVNQSKKGTDGAIVGCRWVEGRWPGKGALDFKQRGDRVRINVPDECQALTLATWVRFDGFDRWLSSLLLTDGWDRGEPHWQVSWDGELILGVYGSINARQKGVLSQDDLGRWIHLVSVYDPKSKTIRHYRDGRPVGSERMWTALPLVIGSAQIGNWDPKGYEKNTVRNLNGRMDELAIFKRALSEKKIKAMYEAGRLD